MPPRPLTPREARFVAAYRRHGQTRRAAREAGYSEDSATGIGWKLLRKPRIIAALAAHGIAIELGASDAGDFAKTGRSYKRNGMTLLQERFVAEYLIDGNATQAAIRAGLPTTNPGPAGSRMLALKGVRAAIERERASREARLRVSADRVIAELARIAFADIGDVADWGPGGVTLKEKDTLAKDDRAAVAELSSEKLSSAKGGAQRTHVKMHSKHRALDALARHLGLWGPGARIAANAAGQARDKDARARLIAKLERIAKGEESEAVSNNATLSQRVIPAKAGIQGDNESVALNPGLRRGDE